MIGAIIELRDHGRCLDVDMDTYDIQRAEVLWDGGDAVRGED